MLLVVLGGSIPAAQAKSLEDTLNELTEFSGVTVPSSVSQKIIEIEQSAVRTADFVATATTPGVYYRFDVKLDVPERVSFSRGPIFIEPAYTVGRGNFDVGFNYLYADFTELDGTSLTEALDDLSTPPGPGDLFQTDVTTFDLRSQIFSFSLTYGLLDRLDVNLLLPLVLTELDLRGTSNLVVGGVPFSKITDEREEKFGVGDILLRTKWRALDKAGFSLAPLFSLRVPSGDEDNFQGLGEVVLTPAFAVTRGFGRYDLHFNAGVDIDTGDLDGSRVRYALGGNALVFEPLGIFLDVLGSSAFTDDEFTAQGLSGTIARTDIVDLATGITITLPRNLLLYAGVIIPLTSDGIRPDAIASGGIEANF
jgi:hypothetical protein